MDIVVKLFGVVVIMLCVMWFVAWMFIKVEQDLYDDDALKPRG
jgi:hypothetical protein